MTKNALVGKTVPHGLVKLVPSYSWAQKQPTDKRLHIISLKFPLADMGGL